MFCGQVFLRCKIPCRDRLRNGVVRGIMVRVRRWWKRRDKREGEKGSGLEERSASTKPRRKEVGLDSFEERAELIRPFEGKVYRKEFRGTGWNGVSIFQAKGI